MNVLLIGSGARESAIAWKLSQSGKLNKLYCSPGNSGTSKFGEGIGYKSNDELLQFALKNNIDITIIGPEEPLTQGITDLFKEKKLSIFGPSKKASRIESSKVWAKNIFNKYSIPTAKSYVFENIEEASNFLKTRIPKEWVIKVDGLAAGKGVFLPKNIEESNKYLKKIFIEKAFGDAGENIIIEEKLFGTEVSVFAFVKNNMVSNCIAACDYKRINDNDEGLNTGGMGAISPPPFWTSALEKKIREKIFEPTAKALVNEGSPFSGILFGGLMISKSGIKVLEFNCRFGDPETQVLMPKIESDILDIFLKISNPKDKSKVFIQVNKLSSVGVVMASGGYPEKYTTGYEINGLNKNISNKDKSIIFEGGAKYSNNGKIITDGGRVLICVGLGDNLNEAKKNAYSTVDLIDFKDMRYRKDIGENRSL